MSGKSAGFGGMLKLGIILAIYSTIACVGLAFVYTKTAAVIEQRKLTDQNEALNELFKDAEFEPIKNIESGDPAVTIDKDAAFAAFKNGEMIGAVLRTSRASYGGDIKILVGIGKDGKISGIKILEHRDTPGLGANAVKPAFYGQFAGMPVSFDPDHDVETITAATITSRAVAESVKAAGEAAMAWFASGATEMKAPSQGAKK